MTASLDGDVVGGLPDAAGGGRVGGGVLVVDGVVAVVGLVPWPEGVAVLEGGEPSGAAVMRHDDGDFKVTFG